MLNIQVPQLEINDDLYIEENEQGYPAIAWHGKYKGTDAEKGGFFAIDQDAIEGVPEDWEETEIQYGDDPNADFVPVYLTRTLTCTPIGVRKRTIITDEHGEEHVYPWRTPKRQRVEGKFTSHFQVMVMVPGLEEPVVLGLHGETKTTSWDNDESGRYRNNNFATGVEQLLRAFADIASEQNGYPLPTVCLWQITLLPLFANGKPHYVTMGNGKKVTHMNPFTARMNSASPDYIDAAFVGQENFAANQTLRQEVATEWEKQKTRPRCAKWDVRRTHLLPLRFLLLNRTKKFPSKTQKLEHTVRRVLFLFFHPHRRIYGQNK